MEQKFIPLLFGGDINVYSVARAFHEAYGIKSSCWGKFPVGVCYESAIIDYHADKTIESDETFVKTVLSFAAAHADKTVLLIGCGDSYVKLATDHKAEFPANVIAPYIDGALMEELTDKERFYDLCDKYGIDHPGTFIYQRRLGHDFTLPFSPPYICKPANSVTYWEHPFEDNKKVFILPDRAALEATLDRAYAAGYPDAMIIQEFIPGDDSFMRVLTSYSDASGRVKLMCLGHVLLEEHTPHGIGNYAAILTAPNDELYGKFKDFLEDIGFVGFSNIDIKYDSRDGKYKAFEVNCRQGRSNFYVTGAGHNIAKILVEDRVEGKELPLTLCDTPSLWRVVPQKVLFDYTPKSYHPQIRKRMEEGRDVNPLFYSPDKGLKRRLGLWKNQLGHFYKFKKYYQKPQ